MSKNALPAAVEVSTGCSVAGEMGALVLEGRDNDLEITHRARQTVDARDHQRLAGMDELEDGPELGGMSTIATDSVQATCRPCSGNPSTETSNSTADRPVLRGTCPDADHPSVEAAEVTVSHLKAPEHKLERTQARKGGNPDTGRPMVGAAEIRRCRRTTEISQSRRSPITPCFWGIQGTQTNYRTVAMGIAFRTSMIVSAPYVS